MNDPHDIFVFGSNIQGRHGKGAALHARRSWGARHGQGEGPQGNAYAIPTKGTPYQSLPLAAVRQHVGRFLDHARQHPERRFLLTKIGCGLAGFTEAEIAPLFEAAPDNVVLINDAGAVDTPANRWSARIPLGERAGPVPPPANQ